MMPLLGTYGFLFPAVLIALPMLVGFLIYVYRRRGRGNRVLVSSVLLLRLLERQVTARRRFVPPLRFFFELLLLLLLLAASAGLSRDEPQQRAAVVIDNSFSMAAHDSGGLGDTRLSSAVRAVRETVRRMGASARVDLFVTSPALRSLTGGLVDRSEALDKLGEVAPAYAGDNLEAALERVSARGGYQRILVFTDKEREQGVSDRDPRVVLQRVGAAEGAENVAIAGISLERGGLRDRRRGVQVSLTSFARQEAQCIVSLEAVLSADSGAARKPLGERRVTLGAGQRASLSFNEIPPEAAAVAASLVVQGSFAEKLNAQKEDDRAYLSLAGEEPLAGFVGGIAPHELGLSKLPALRFLHIAPEQYEKRSKELAGVRFLIFHRVGVNEPPEKPSLFILPPAESGFMRAAAEARPAEITGWKESHALVRYLNLPALRIANLHPLLSYAGAEEIIRSTAGTVMAAGELQGRRMVGVGIELLPYEGSASPLLSVLTLNILDWISSSGLAAGYRSVHAPLELAPDVESVEYLGGETLYRRGGQQDAADIELAHPGLVVLRRRDGTSTLLAVDYFDEQESNHLTPQRIHLPAGSPAAADGKGEANLLSGSAALAVLLLILIDLAVTLLLAHRRKAAA